MAKKSRVANTALNTSAGIFAKLINIFSGFIMRTVFIHTIGIAYTGVSSLFTDILTMLSFSELGISTAMTYALYKPVAEGDHRHVAMIMNFYKKAYRIVAAVVLIAGLSLVPFLHILVPADKIDQSNPAIRDQILGQLTLIYILYVINSAVSYLFIYKSAILTAHQEQRYASRVQMIISLVRVAVECTILFAFRSYSFCFILYLIVGIILTRTENVIISRTADRLHPQISQQGDVQLPEAERKKIFKDIRALMLYKFSSTINSSIDSVIISAMFGSIWVAYVSNYRLVTTKLQSLINQFYNSVTPSVGNLVTESDEDKQYTTFRTLLFTSFWLLCFCSTSLIVLLNPFVEIWIGPQYVKSQLLVVVLVASTYLSTFINPVTAFRTSNGLFVEGRFRPVAMLVINVILSFVMAFWLGGTYGEEWGIIGVKLATIIASLLTLQWFDPWLVYKHVFKRPVLDYLKTFLLYTLITAGCAAVTYGLGALLPDFNRYLRFVVLCLLCVIVPNGVVVLLFRNTPEFKAFAAILGRFGSKLKKKLGRIAG